MPATHRKDWSGRGDLNSRPPAPKAVAKNLSCWSVWFCSASWYTVLDLIRQHLDPSWTQLFFTTRQTVGRRSHQRMRADSPSEPSSLAGDDLSVEHHYTYVLKSIAVMEAIIEKIARSSRECRGRLVSRFNLLAQRCAAD